MRWDNARERLRQFERVFDDIRRESNQGAVILVEGKNDKRSLRKLGVEGEVVKVSGNGKSLTATAERVSAEYETAILLTDWDSQGDALKRKLKELLESYGVTPQTIQRKRLRNLTSKEIYDVESLVAHKQNIEKETPGERV